jgi:hypothetical protein
MLLPAPSVPSEPAGAERAGWLRRREAAEGARGAGTPAAPSPVASPSSGMLVVLL